MSRRALVALAAGILPLVAACGQVAPTASPIAPPPVSAAAPTTTSATPLEAPAPPASPTPAQAVTQAPRWTPSPTPTPSRTPTPKASASPVAKVSPDDPCVGTVLRYGSKGACVKKAQGLLKNAGMYSPKLGTTFGVASVNWTLVYQRSRGITDTGTIGPETWAALVSNRARLPESLPSTCRTSGVVLCASKAHNKLYWLKDGVVKKTVQVRFGGFTDDKYGKYRLHPTVNGTYRVYNKHSNPCSERYGCGAMPYSTMFDPNMYVHYSAPFASQGYSTSSHGCVNVKTKTEAQWIMKNTPIGAKVVVY